MAKLADKIENALNETRILVLGIQIFIGFSYRSFFEPGFEKMTPLARQLQLSSLGLMLVGLGVLLVPAPYHRLALQGRNSAGFHRITTAAVSAGLLPFALAMALSFFLGLNWVVDAGLSAIVAGGLLGTTLFFWYGLELAARKAKSGALHLHATLDPLRGADMTVEKQTDLSTRVKQVLIECRVVLPGAQALLGFQLIIMWMTEFYKIPQSWKLLHLVSLTATAVCTILLIAPAAYHRIVEQGEDTETLHDFTSRLLLWAMVFLAWGVCGDFYVVARLTGLGPHLSAALSLGLLAFFYGAWFGYTLWKRRLLHGHGSPPMRTRQRPAA